MKAVLHTKFGPPDELKVGEVPEPDPKENEVLVKVHYSSVTSSDCNMRNLTFAPSWGKIPFRIFVMGIRKPRHPIMGMDFSGIVEKIGSRVTKFKVGDHVFGTRDVKMRAHAEYLVVREDNYILEKPESIPWNEAVCIPLAGVTALHFIRDLGKVTEGQQVLIVGASGGIGTFAVQLAKYYGAKVTGVCSTKNIELVKSIGADYVIDYTKDEYTKSTNQYDVIFDAVGKTSYSACKTILKKEGKYLAVMLSVKLMFQMITHRNIKSGMATTSLEKLEFLKQLYVEKKIKSVIGKTFSLEQTAEAFAYVETGHKVGNVVIKISD